MTMALTIPSEPAQTSAPINSTAPSPAWGRKHKSKTKHQEQEDSPLYGMDTSLPPHGTMFPVLSSGEDDNIEEAVFSPQHSLLCRPTSFLSGHRGYGSYSGQPWYAPLWFVPPMPYLMQWRNWDHGLSTPGITTDPLLPIGIEMPPQHSIQSAVDPPSEAIEQVDDAVEPQASSTPHNTTTSLDDTIIPSPLISADDFRQFQDLFKRVAQDLEILLRGIGEMS